MTLNARKFKIFANSKSKSKTNQVVNQKLRRLLSLKQKNLIQVDLRLRSTASNICTFPERVHILLHICGVAFKIDAPVMNTLGTCI